MTPERLDEIKRLLAKTFPNPSDMISAREAAKELVIALQATSGERDLARVAELRECQHANEQELRRANAMIGDLRARIAELEATVDAQQVTIDEQDEELVLWDAAIKPALLNEDETNLDAIKRVVSERDAWKPIVEAAIHFERPKGE